MEPRKPRPREATITIPQMITVRQPVTGGNGSRRERETTDVYKTEKGYVAVRNGQATPVPDLKETIADLFD